jgi:hypothetical protein
MKKAEVLEEYFLEEESNVPDLVGWKVIGRVDTSKITSCPEFSLKTNPDGWIEEFGVHVVSSGIVLVSDNCPFLLKDEILNILSEYISSEDFVGGPVELPTITEEDINKWILDSKTLDSIKTYPTWVYNPGNVYYNGANNSITTSTSSADNSTVLTSTATLDSSTLDSITSAISNYYSSCNIDGCLSSTSTATSASTYCKC